jgi:hypothetical protein
MVIAMLGRAGFAVVVVVELAGCGKFQDPNVVVDLRVLAITATPPTQVIDVDLTQPIDPAALLGELVPTVVCALIADPALDRRLTWSIGICPYYSDRRCDDGSELAVASGVLDDPDTTVPEPALCATIAPGADLLGLLLDQVQGDALHGLGGIDYAVQLRVGGEDADRALDQYAAKTIRVSPRIPATATANTNPTVARIDTSIDDVPAGALPLARCVDQPPALAIPAGVKLRMTPVEPDGAREVYTLPTLDGMSQTFTESLTYQWIAGAGGFSRGDTGGPHDLAGNPAPLFTDFRAPGAGDLMGPTDVSVWIVQRDERLGARWYEACVHVVP